jgi:hypothetical protein
VLIGLPLLFAVFWISSHVHETAHALVCSSYGGEFSYHVDPIFRQGIGVSCFNFGGNDILLRASGGLAGIAACLVPTMVFRKQMVMLIGFLPNAIPHSINAFNETVFYEWYIAAGQEAKDIATYPMFVPLVILVALPLVSKFLLKKPIQ